MEENTQCSVSESSAHPFHFKNGAPSPHHESSDTHVRESHEMPDSGVCKSLGCDLVPGFSEPGGRTEGFPRCYEVGFISDVASVKTQIKKTENNEKESSSASDLVEKEEKDSLKCGISLAGSQGFGEFSTGVSEKLPAMVENSAVQAGFEDFSAVSSFAVDGKVLSGKTVETESSLEVRKKHLLEELEAMIMPGDKINAEEGSGSDSSGVNMGNSASIGVPDEKMIDCQEVHKAVQDGDYCVHRLEQSVGSARCSLEIEVIDETALIGSVFFPKNGHVSGMMTDFLVSDKHTKRQGSNLPKDMDEKKVKRSRRREKAVKGVLETDEKAKSVIQMTETRIGGPKNGEGTRIEYTREELEALRFVKIGDQRKMWKDIYLGLGPTVSKEYDNLASSKPLKNIPLNCESGKGLLKKEELPGLLSKYSNLIHFVSCMF